MKIITSVSGGQTSSYIAANYNSDYLLFALVRIEDINCKFKDNKIRKLVEDKIQAPFIGTAEDDIIIYTILDLEQYLGKNITWVTGQTFDELIKSKSILPNKMRRFCTQMLKIDPMFKWWYNNIKEPIKMQIGFRSNELNRANKMLSNINEKGLIEYKTTFEKLNNRNKWVKIGWQKPEFPLIKDAITKNDIINYWKDKPVRFALYNNCVGCFHRNPVFLRWMYDLHPNKMQWFENQEIKSNWMDINGEIIPYKNIRKILPQMKFTETDFTSCDTGYCGL